MSFRHILVPLDGSALAEGAIPHAEQLAKTFAARVTLLKVLEASPALAEQCDGSVDWRLRRLEAEAYLREASERLGASGIECECEVSEGRAADEIISFARKRAVDLTVLNAYGWGGVSQFPFGGTVQKVLSARGLSCLVARAVPALAARGTGYRRILVPLDGSQRAEWAAHLACGLAQRSNAELILLQVVPVPDMPRRVAGREELELRDKFVECNRRVAAQYLEDLAERLRRNVQVHTRLEVAARVVPAIRQVSDREGADLVVMTGHGNAGPNGVIQGSICTALMSYANLPVLVLRDGQGDSAAVYPPRIHTAERNLRAMN